VRTCPNCGNQRVEKYCPECGQRFGRSLACTEVFRVVADDQFSIDAKLPRTLHALFLRPGRLTAEYRDGRVARYIPPFRLYLLASVLFFVLLSFLSRRSDWAERAELEIRKDMATDTLTSDTIKSDSSWISEVEVNFPWQWLDQKLETNIKALAQLPPSVAMRRVVDTTLEETPKVMFVLLPVFALMLKLLYFRRARFYIEHFVFALHFHAFAYVLFSIALIIGSGWVFLIPAIVLPVYLLLAMRRAYAQGWIRTVIKWFVLSNIYSILLVTGLLFALIWALAAS
jgi:hypothetical protein